MKKYYWIVLFGICMSPLSGGDVTSLFSAGKSKSQEILIPAGEHQLSRTINVARDLRIVFAHGAVIRSKVSPVFRVKSGKLMLEGKGEGGTIHCSAKSGGVPAGIIATVIDVTGSTRKSPASLSLRNMSFYSDRGIDGVVKNHSNGKLGPLEVDKCRFISKFRGISIYNMELASCRITNSLFDGGLAGIFAATPIPGGAYVCGNTVRNFGKSGIILGKTGQIAEGITKLLPMATVHDNRLLRGGFAATVKDSYIHGILVMGHNVSVQGNIVRDVNRGVPVPGAKCGHQIVENGKVFKERMRKSGKGQIRLAGSAIYLKANRAVVHSNVCTNSGWRSVIEIKTGGKEYYTSVVNNVVDGRSLAVNDSFAFECNSGRSLWANNIVYDVPHQAFVVRCGYENTYLNNLIVNAKVGFALSGNPHGEHELINGNRFIDVRYPVSLNGASPRNAAGADIYRMPQSYIFPDMELPAPSEANAGRLIVRGKSLYCCVRTERGFAWMELNGRIVPEKKWVPVGQELAVNADQSGKGYIPAELNDPLHPGWIMGMMSAREKKLSPSDGYVSFDNKDFLTGGRSLKVKFKNTTGSFSLHQTIKIVPGKRYRVSAVVKGEEPRTLSLSVRTNKGFARSVRAVDSQKWQTLSFDFIVPAGHRRCTLSVYAGKTSVDKAAWLDSVSFRELAEESSVSLSKKNAVGKNLIDPVKGWRCAPGKNDLSFENKNGMISLTAVRKRVNAVISQKVKFAPGKNYRIKFDSRSDEKLQVTAFVKINGQRVSKSFESGSLWKTHCLELTVPAGEKTDALNIWIGKIMPEKGISFRNITCHELEK